MKYRVLGFLGGLLLIFGWALVPGVAVAAGQESGTAASSCGAKNYLGFRPWYQGLCEGSGENASIKSPEGTQEGIGTFVWTIVLNVMFDVLLVVGYLAIGFVIYGGFQYIMSQGDPGKAAKAKKTLMMAIIGTIVAMGATVIVNTGTTILGIDRAKGWEQAEVSQEQIQNAFNWAYAVAGMVAVVFIVYGGVTYVIAQGDPGKISKATKTLVYAVIGLVIVILAALITSFITGSIGSSLE